MAEAKAETTSEAKLDLAAGLLRSGGRIQLSALGASMLPALWPGDLLSIEGANAAGLSPGEIVLVHRDGRFFIHRLIQCGSPSGSEDWVTRGDALPRCDPPTASCDVIGCVCGITRGGRMLVPRPKPSWPARMFAWAVRHSDSLRGLALRFHSARQKLHILNWSRLPDRDYPRFSPVAKLPKE